MTSATTSSSKEPSASETKDNSKVLPSSTVSTVDDRDYQALFHKLDIEGHGEITLKKFREALRLLNHPFSGNEVLTKATFDAFDANHDNVIDFDDLQRYLKLTDDQILRGFNKIDIDKDGKLDREDLVRYLQQTLDITPSDSTVDMIFKLIDYKKDGIVTYDEFRAFLLLMPRLYGSRIKTVFRYIPEELDLSSEGDVTPINQFFNGIGFFLAGGLSGVVSRTCTAPFDRIKVFLIARTDLASTVLHSKSEIEKQIYTSSGKRSMQAAGKQLMDSTRDALYRIAEHPKTIRSPIIQAARTIWKQGGLKAFYVGNGLNVLKVFPEASMKFGSFELTKKFLGRIEGVNDVSQLSKLSTYFAGGLGGVVSQFAVYPIDTLKFRLQCSNLDSALKGNELLIYTAKNLYKEGGIKVFYRGIFVGVSGIFPYAALDLGTFSTIKNSLIKRESRRTGVPENEINLPNYITLTLGALSGTFGATMVYPINLLRTRLQAQGTFAHPYRYTGFTDVLRQTIKREGYPGLFKGLVPNLAKVAPAVSISYFMYENLKYLFRLDNSIK